MQPETPSPALALPTPPTRATSFLVLVRYRATLLKNVLDEHLKSAPWRMLVVIALLVVIWAALYLLLFTIFSQIRRWGLISVVADQHVFIYFFLVLAIMLAFSSAILSFGSLFGRDEPGFLLAMPVAPRHVICVKWLEGMVLSSWSFMLLGVPLMCAVASTATVRWYYFPLFIAHFVGFVTIPATVGILAAWAVAMWAPRRPAPTAIWFGCVALLLVIFWIINIYQKVNAAADEWLRVVFEYIGTAKQPLLPSTWTANGILAAIGQRVDTSLFYLAVVVGNAAFLAWATINLLGATWAEAYSRARQGRYQPTIRVGWFTLALSWMFFFYLPRRLRLLVLKDLRSFTRDATQWTQMVIMFGLLAIYVLNLPRLPVDLGNPSMKALISFLNLTTVSLILATFTSRFVYPLLSLESQQLWLVGLLPMQRSTILLVKFAFALTLTAVSAMGVLAIAAGVLNLPPVWLAVHFIVTMGVCCGLCGLAVGLGARFPVLGQRNPARIAAGFGGTFNLIVSMVFVLVQMAGVAYVSFSGIKRTGEMLNELSPEGWIIVIALILMSMAMTAAPLWIGARNLLRLEH